MVYQCRLVDCNKCTTFVQDVGSRETVHVLGKRYTGTLCTFSSILL